MGQASDARAGSPERRFLAPRRSREQHRSCFSRSSYGGTLMNRRLAGTSMLVFALIGCSDKSSPIGPPPPQGAATPQQLTIGHEGNRAGTDFTGWTIGASRTFSATVRYRDGSSKKVTAV